MSQATMDKKTIKINVLGTRYSCSLGKKLKARVGIFSTKTLMV